MRVGEPAAGGVPAVGGVTRTRAARDAGPQEPRALPRLGVRAMLVWAVVVGALAYAGRLTATSEGAPSLVAPATAAAVLWMLSRGARALSVDGLLLVAVLVAVTLATQVPVPVAGALVAGALVQVGVTVLLLRRWCGGIWGVGRGAGRVDSLGALLRLLVATAAGGLAGGLGGLLGLVVDGVGVDWLDVAVLLGRALAGGLLVVPPGLVVGRAVAVRRRSRPADEGGAVELVALGVVSVAIYVGAFIPEGVPLAFPLLVATGWAALRFSTAVSTVHSVVAGLAVVGFTLGGHGPFTVTADPRSGAALAQLFVCVVVVAGLIMAVGRDERRSLLQGVRRAEGEARMQSDLLRATVDTMHDGLIVLEEGTGVVLRNPAAARYAEMGEFQVFDASGRLVPPAELPSRRAVAGESVSGRYGIRGADDRELQVEIAAMPLPRSGEGGRRAVVVFRDVTDQELQRRELVAFAGVVAHDLKNPLTTIDGWTEVLADELEGGEEPDPVLAATVVEKLQSASGRMKSLIRHLLEHATSRDAAMRPEVVDVEELVRDIAEGRDATASVEIRDVPPVRADAAMVRQLLENLVGNALKYVVPGEPAHVVVDGSPAPGETGTVAVRVTDNGVGIPDESKGLVFQQFYRAHASEYAGTGLGLAICRRIVDRHGGTITVRDNPEGRGTQIEVLLPAADADDASLDG